MQGEKIFWEHVTLIDLSTHLPFLTFPRVRGEITHSAFLARKYSRILSITICLCLVLDFRGGGNLQLQVSATINREGGDNIDIGG